MNNYSGYRVERLENNSLLSKKYCSNYVFECTDETFCERPYPHNL